MCTPEQRRERSHLSPVLSSHGAAYCPSHTPTYLPGMPGMQPMMDGAPSPGFRPPPGEELPLPPFLCKQPATTSTAYVVSTSVLCQADGWRAGMAPPPGWRPGMMAAPPGMNGMPGPHPGMMPMSVGGPPQQQHYGMR